MSRSTLHAAEPAAAGLAQWRECWRTPHHVAVIHGPDAGWVVPLRDGGTVVVGRGADADLIILDPGISRRHCAVRESGGHMYARAISPSTPTYLIRDVQGRAHTNDSRGTERPSPRGRARPLTSRWSRIRAGDTIHIAATRIMVRPHPSELVLGELSAASAPAHSTIRRSGLAAVMPFLGLIPTVGMVAFFALRRTGTPDEQGEQVGGHSAPIGGGTWLLIGLAVAALLGIAAAIVMRRRRRARTSQPLSVPAPATDPAAFAVAVAGAGERDERWPEDRWHNGSPDAEFVAIPSQPVAIHGPGAAGLRRWFEVQRPAQIHTAPNLQDVPGTPALLLDARERLGVAPEWIEIVTLARTGGAPDRLLRLLGQPTRTSIASGWLAATQPDLAVTLARSGSHLISFDLRGQGPHALVAGTTGSGKSDLLAAWVLALAVRNPPALLSFILVDYKGGATFGPLAHLPHVAGVVSDLDPTSSARAIASLQAEVRRREHILAARGARDLDELRERGESLAALVVVIDEFRVLAIEQPDRMEDLVRLAAQGRSLGIHLILATQRPAGAVSSHLRANVGMRLCLRVLDATDSTDVLGTPAAAQLPIRPGVALMANSAQRMQIGWLPARDREALVVALEQAASLVKQRRHGDLLAVHRPWLPPLPPRLEYPDLRALALTDHPHAQAQTPFTWEAGLLLVTGPPASGRSAALRTCVAVQLEAGRACHVIARTTEHLNHASGTVVATSDPRRLIRLLSLLASGADPEAALIIDDLESVIDAIDGVEGLGSGLTLITAILRHSTSRPVALATGAPHRWTALARHHLALRPDRASAGILGVHRDLLDDAHPAGRGALLTDGTWQLAHVVLTPPGRLGTPVASPEHLKLIELPTHVELREAEQGTVSRGEVAEVKPPSLAAGPGQLITMGLGGDEAAPVRLALESARGWLVVGPAGTGRTATLATIAAQWHGEVAWVTPDSPVLGHETGARLPLVLIDDAEQIAPSEADALTAQLIAARVPFVVALTPEALVTSYRGVVALVRESRTVIALGGFTPPHLPAARSHRDPLSAVVPGRAVIISPSFTGAVQLLCSRLDHHTTPHHSRPSRAA